MTGVLHGVGVGPGDPELLTLKAARIVRESRVVAYFAKKGGSGRARGIAASLLSESHEEMPLYYPVTLEIPVEDVRYKEAMRAFYEDAAERIALRLATGDVAVLCEGDPFLYGSFMHLYVRLAERFECRVVPGVMAMSGCAAAAGLPMAWGNDMLTILPATLPQEVLEARLRETDAAVIMKIGRNLPKLREALHAVGKLERATYVECGTMPEQRILPLSVVQEAPYFSLVLIPPGGMR